MYPIAYLVVKVLDTNEYNTLQYGDASFFVEIVVRYVEKVLQTSEQ